MFRRYSIIFASLTILTLLFAACGGAAPVPADDAGSTTEETSADESSSEDAAPAQAMEGSEAPMLAEKVAAGELPPLDERLPAEPLIIEPFGEIGQYGGTLHRFDTSTNGSRLSMFMYGYSPVHWVRDGLDKRPGLAKDWDFNEDKTEYNLYFREGTKWSDGDPFTVDDFMYWWEDMVLNEDHTDGPPDYMISGGEVAEVTKVDDYTLNIKFAASSPLFLDRLAMWSNGMVPESERLFVPSHYLEQFNPKINSEYDTYEVHDEKMDWRANPEAPVLNPWMPVEYEPGTRIILERNPYYWAVDTAGNQLPYIDTLDVTYIEDWEVGKFRVLAGEMEFCGRPCQDTPLADLSLFRDAEGEVGLVNGLWDSGGGSGPAIYPNWTHLDPQKRELYQDKNFRRALSHAIDREKVQKIVYFGTGELTTGTMSPKGIEFQGDVGQDLYQQWRDLAVAFDLDTAATMLDEAGAVDADGDGFRDLPSGDELLLRIDCSAGGIANTANAQTMEIIKEGWEALGLQTQINVVPDEQMGVMQDNSEYDIRGCWGIGDGPNFLVFPNWVVWVDNNRTAPLYGAFYKGIEPSEEPPEGDPAWTLWDIYDRARVEPDDAARLEITQDIIRVHIEEGPFFIGTVANAPYIISWLDSVGNVPTKEQLGQGGFIGPWIMSYFGALYPEQFYYKQ